MKRSITHIATLALMLNLGVAGIYAQQNPVRMTFSGNGAPSAINLQQPNTNTLEENVAGNGTLGPFTFRNVSAAEPGWNDAEDPLARARVHVVCRGRPWRANHGRSASFLQQRPSPHLRRPLITRG